MLIPINVTGRDDLIHEFYGKALTAAQNDCVKAFEKEHGKDANITLNNYMAINNEAYTRANNALDCLDGEATVYMLTYGEDIYFILDKGTRDEGMEYCTPTELIRKDVDDGWLETPLFYDDLVETDNFYYIRACHAKLA